ncbi:MAG: MinD/ParA family protein [bacterium]|nr:MinD/ParA family protein [bacterium]
MDQATNLRNIIRQHELQTNQPATKSAKIITVTSGKGGVGKSNISINLAISLSKLGNRVIVLDADFGLANVEVMLGIRPQYSLADLMFRGKSIKEVITSGPEGIGFISGGSGIEELIDLDAYQIKNISERLYELDELADYIIIDTGAGISDGLMQFIGASDRVLLVATPEPTSITDAYAVLKSVSRTFEDSEEPMRIDLVANRVFDEHDGRVLHSKLNVVAAKFLRVDLQLAGSVVQDMNITKSVMAQKPITLAYPNSPAASSIKQLASKIHDGSSIQQEEEPRGGIRKLFSGFLNRKR